MSPDFAGAVDDLSKSIELVEAMNFKVFPEPGASQTTLTLLQVPALSSPDVTEALQRCGIGALRRLSLQVGLQFVGDARKSLGTWMPPWRTTRRR